MKLQFLGTGGAFTNIKDNYQSNMVLHAASGRCLLIDCGSDARHSLAAQGYSYKNIDAVYISHLHADHVGGLEWLAFTTYFDPQQKKPKLYIHPDLRERLWRNVLSGGLESLEGDRIACLDDFFEVVPLFENSFSWEHIIFHLIRTIHVFNGPTLTPSYGLYFSTPQYTIFLTTDTQFQPLEYQSYFDQADIIFHDCDTNTFQSPVHAHFSQLSTLPAVIKAKMWLYHYHSDNGLNPHAQGFLGFVRKGQQFIL